MATPVRSRSVVTVAALALLGSCSYETSTPMYEPALDASVGGDGPHADQTPTVLHFAVVGDYGVDDPDGNELHVAQLIAGWRPDFVLTVGDNNYPSGEADTIDQNIGKYYGAFIGGYHGAYGPGSLSNRFWPALGNHEWYTMKEPPPQPYLDYFPDLPGNKRYYDVDFGLVHIFALDSDPHEPDGTTAASAQAAWLKAALAASTACYNVVYFHHPPYSSGMFSVEWMRWPFAAWGADVVLAGHEHTYERLAVDGIPYFIDGLGGANIFGFLADNPYSQHKFNADYGAMLVTATAMEIRYEFWTQAHMLVESLRVSPRRCPH